jgi:CheY-like chemotaxis protein
MLRKTYEQPLTPQVATIPDTVQIERTPDLKGVKVLVADDERDARNAIAMALGLCGAQVETAHNADEALSAASRTNFDVVLTDLAMPDGDGFSLLRGLRLRQKKMPVIALSAMRGAQIEKEVKDAGFSLHVDKPIELSYITAAVADMVFWSKNKN